MNITVHRPRRISPAQFYEALVSLLGMRNHPDCPPPWGVERLELVSDGADVHLELTLSDGRTAVVDFPLDRGIHGLI